MKYKNFAFLIFATVLILLSLNLDVRACLCAKSSPCDSFGTASAVFIGVVENYEKTENFGTYRIKVEKVIAGETVPIVKAYSILKSSCAFDGFIVGERYLIYARSFSDKQVKEFPVSLCDRIFSIEAIPQEYWEFIESTRPKMKGSKIYGVVFEEGSLMSGIEIKIIGQGDNYKLTTDKSGRFEIEGLKPGEYLILVSLPQNKVAYNGNSRRTYVFERGCRQENFGVRNETLNLK